MAGKAYTMREMRSIVEYLKEHKAYGELKGRKMWMEFANSNQTVRTWQSLKETFLKRIFPDIHNPYYRLTMEEVCSFKQGFDVAAKEKHNKLEFRSPENNKNAKNKKDRPTTRQSSEEKSKIINKPSATDIDEELEKVTGEDSKATKPIPCRSSTETVNLEYVDAEDVQRALESPAAEIETQPKPSKDKITFEETPMTPLVRELIHDFDTESEASDKEPQLKIVEEPPQTNEAELKTRVDEFLEQNMSAGIPSENGLSNNKPHSIITIHDSVNTDNHEANAKNNETTTVTLFEDSQKNIAKDVENENPKKDTQTKTTDQDTHIPTIQISPQKDEKNIKSKSKDRTVFLTAETSPETFEKPSNTSKNNSNNVISNTAISTQNTSSDTLLPNNQEALDDSKKGTQNLDKTPENINGNKVNKLGKKSTPQKDNKETKKQNNANDKSKERNNDKDEVSAIEIIESSQSIIGNYNPNTEIIEINTDNPATETTEQQIDLTKPILRKDDKINTHSKDDPNATKNQDTSMKEKNPCLMSVSLFEEQFKNTEYSDSDSDRTTKLNPCSEKPQTTINAKEQLPQQAKENIVPDIEMKKTTVESKESKQADVNIISSAESDSKVKSTVRLQREKAIANAFGFSHGAAPSNRKRRWSHRRSHHHHRRHSKNVELDSNPSEWTSESDSESYVSPPRGRRYRETRKFLKPKSHRVLQDPGEGLLYVMFGKNIYPVVRDGKHIKRFLTYEPNSDSDEDVAFWKQKYSEVKEKNDDMKKLLKETQKMNATEFNEHVPNTTARNDKQPLQKSQKIDNNDRGATTEKENKVETKDEKMVIKIAGKNGLEYSLEGGWEQISHAMPQVVKMLQAEAAPDTRKDNGTSRSNTDSHVELSSGHSTPLPTDKEAVEKVNKLETEIFNEIKTLEDIEQVKEVKITDSDNSNVTNRKRGRPRKQITLSPISNKISTKRTRTPRTSSTDSKPERKRASKAKLKDGNQNEKKTEAKQVQNEETTTMVPPLELKSPNKAAKNKEADVIVRSRSSSRLSKQRGQSVENLGNRQLVRSIRTPKKYDTDASASGDKPRTSKGKATVKLFDDEEARYMFPPGKTNNETTGNKNRSLPRINIMPPQEIIGNTIEITQEYQDSDQSLLNICLPKRKRRVSYVARKKYKERRVSRITSRSLLIDELSCDSSNSTYFVPVRKSLSSLNSEIYKSESYRFLVPKEKIAYENLEPIDVNRPVLDKYYSDTRHFNSVSKDSNKSADYSGFTLEVGSSSIVSLPVSPELSVVEHLSVSREVIKNANHPTLNEVQLNEQSQPADYSEYMISHLDVSVPLMNQTCNLKNIHEAKKNNNIIDSMQLKDCTVNLTLSDSIDRRLEELLLETNKKPKAKPRSKKSKSTPIPMEVDQTTVKKTKSRKKTENVPMDGDLSQAPEDKSKAKERSDMPRKRKTPVKKPKSCKQKENVPMDVDVSQAPEKKSRPKEKCATPRKRKPGPKSKTLIDPAIEEHVESCSARRSCPPVVTLFSVDENANNSCDVMINPPTTDTKKEDKSKIRKHKPKDKKPHDKKSKVGREKSENASIGSTYIDSSINGSRTMSLLKDSCVDLIHNHSETCLMATECIDYDSVEFVQKSPISTISLSSGSRQSENSEFFKDFKSDVSLSEDTSNNLDNLPETKDFHLSSPESVYLSPISSLMTEDLSNSPKQPSEKQEVTNLDSASNVNFLSGSNLQQLFPIACAVPNLSTITEKSQDSEV